MTTLRVPTNRIKADSDNLPNDIEFVAMCIRRTREILTSTHSRPIKVVRAAAQCFRIQTDDRESLATYLVCHCLGYRNVEIESNG